jgi:hypothetical protein
MGNGVMGRIEAPALSRKPPVTATPRPYSHRAHPRLYLSEVSGKGKAPAGSPCPAEPAVAPGEAARKQGF